jgi:hypothetical protein
MLNRINYNLVSQQRWSIETLPSSTMLFRRYLGSLGNLENFCNVAKKIYVIYIILAHSNVIFDIVTL